MADSNAEITNSPVTIPPKPAEKPVGEVGKSPEDLQRGLDQLKDMWSDKVPHAASVLTTEPQATAPVNPVAEQMKQNAREEATGIKATSTVNLEEIAASEQPQAARIIDPAKYEAGLRVQAAVGDINIRRNAGQADSSTNEGAAPDSPRDTNADSERVRLTGLVAKGGVPSSNVPNTPYKIEDKLATSRPYSIEDPGHVESARIAQQIAATAETKENPLPVSAKRGGLLQKINPINWFRRNKPSEVSGQSTSPQSIRPPDSIKPQETVKAA